MSAAPSTIEPIRALALSRVQESFALEGDPLSGGDHLRVTRRERRAAALRESENIARTEMARRRRRLGTLTPEQELSIERFLISTVNKISVMALAALDKESELTSKVP